MDGWMDGWCGKDCVGGRKGSEGIYTALDIVLGLRFVTMISSGGVKTPGRHGIHTTML